jgi:dolichol-phosphate mannosyltransferase
LRGGNHSMTDISLVIPAYNEAATIANNVRELDGYMRGALPEQSFEIIVVDDGSTDGMSDRLLELNISGLKVVRHPYNRGRGAGIRSGFAASSGVYVITLDADLSYSPDHIPRMLAPLQAGEADIVLASAYHPAGAVKNVPFFRAKLSYYGNKVLSAGVRGQLYTLTCMVRAYRREVLRRLELISDGKDLHLEVIQKANLLGYRIAEIPAVLAWRDKSRAKRTGKGSAFPLFAMSGTIVTHLVYHYLLRPGAMLFLPVAFLSSVIVIGLAMLAAAFISHVGALMDRGLLSALYGGLRETLLSGSLTLGLVAGSLVVLLIFVAFYFQSLQSKRQFEELYLLMSRMNDRLKQAEQDGQA